MAQLVVPVGSAIIGGWIGGPIGASLGWTLGSALTADNGQITQPTIGDLRVQSSSYGKVIPYVYGKQRIAPNIIWADDKEVVTDSNSNGKGVPDTVTTVYKLSFAVCLCVGPILGITRVWANGSLIADVSSTQNKLPAGNLYLGNESQTPDPIMEAALGVGQVPAYKGIAYFVFDSFNLGPSGQLPQFSFEVVTEI